jgi:PRC-barrel domain
MARHAIAPMILAASILAVPVLAATSNDAPNNSPAAASSAPTGNMGSARVADTRADHAAPMAAANESSSPRYATADGQLRVGKIVGASVYNDQDQSIGSVDDVLMSHGDKATTAVISVGGFLGMGSKLVSVPFDQLKLQQNRIVMPGATKASLNSMPAYKYNNA